MVSYLQVFVYRVRLFFARRRIQALKLSIRELTAERRRLAALLCASPAGSDEYHRSRIRIKAIDDHLYRLYEALTRK